MPAIYFDMDGTLADFYGVDGWLDYLHNEDTTPYEIAKPLCKEMTMLKHALKTLRSFGYTIGIISWTAKNGSKEYNKATRNAKIEWLRKHFGHDFFTEIHIVKYGTNKSYVAKEKDGILFDDDANVRAKWRGTVYDVDNIINILFSIISSIKEKLKKEVAHFIKNSGVKSPDGHYAYIDKITFVDGIPITKVGKASNIESRRQQQLKHKYSDCPSIKDVEVKHFFTCRSDEDAIAMENVLRAVMVLINPRAYKFNDRLMDYDESYVDIIKNHPETQRWAKEFCIS